MKITTTTPELVLHDGIYHYPLPVCTTVDLEVDLPGKLHIAGYICARKIVSNCDLEVAGHIYCEEMLADSSSIAAEGNICCLGHIRATNITSKENIFARHVIALGNLSCWRLHVSADVTVYGNIAVLNSVFSGGYLFCRSNVTAEGGEVHASSIEVLGNLNVKTHVRAEHPIRVQGVLMCQYLVPGTTVCCCAKHIAQ